ncbi:MAG: hypothetical protein V4488_04885 [Pseudomonadota bacterium]
MKHLIRSFVALAMYTGCAISSAAPAYGDQGPMLIAGKLLLDPAMTPDEQDEAIRNLAQARANIVAVYGEQKADMPEVIWCKMNACVTYFAGTSGRSFATPGKGFHRIGAQHVFWRSTIVFTRPARVRAPVDIRAVETLTHELSHIEFSARLTGASVPAWFNEGVATYVGKEQVCQAGMKSVDTLTELDSAEKWSVHTNRDGKTLVNTYCQASEEVGAWIAARGGFKAIVDLLGKRAWGSSFNSLYGPLMQPEKNGEDSIKETQ